MMIADVIVTKNSNFVALCKEMNLVNDKTKVMESASHNDVRGKHVVGILPLHLAAQCKTITVVPLVDKTGKKNKNEMTLEDMRQIAKKPQSFSVQQNPEEKQSEIRQAALRGGCSVAYDIDFLGIEDHPKNKEEEKKVS